MKHEPLVSIVVNCFNGEKYLREALDSIYQQTYKNWEIIFFDNQSSDNSANIAKSYDSRLKYHYSPVIVPLGEARRQAVEKSTGQWIAFLDSDDLWSPEKLERQLEYANAIDDVFLVYSGISEINEFGDIIRTLLRGSNGEVVFTELLNSFDINMVTPLINKFKLFEAGLNFDSQIEASEEYNLFMRIASFGKVFYLNERLGYYRVYENSLTNKKIHRWAWERFRTIATLLDANPKLLMSSYDDISKAIDRGIYYHACYLLSINDYRGCRVFMRKIKFKTAIYFLLNVLAYFPVLWRVVHSKKWKSKLTRLIQSVL